MDAKPLQPAPRLSTVQLALRTIGSVIGLFVLLVSASVAYTVLLVGHGALAFLYGPEPVVWWLAFMQYGSYVLLDVLVFRYLSRLRPLRFSLSDKENRPPGPGAETFWLNLVVCLLFANFAVHRTGLSLPTFTFDAVLVGLLLYHYSRARLVCLTNGTPLVLFLRPFSSFSDRSLVNGLLNTLPPSTQVVFLVPRQESLRNWDPYTIGLAGIRFLEPIRSAPISLLCRDDEWIESVKYLIGRSALIIVDLSQKTDSLEIELELIREAGACARTIAFIEHSLDPVKAALSCPTPEDAWRGLLTFRRALNIPRAALALAMTATVWLLFGLIDQGALPPAMKVGIVVVAGLFVLHHWSVVFLKKTVRQSVFREARKLVATAIPKSWTHRLTMAAHWAVLVAFACLLWTVGSRIYSQHVTIGDSFAVNSVLRLVNARGREKATLDFTTDIPTLRTEAEWSMIGIPKQVFLEDIEVRIAKGRTSWWHRELYLSDAIFFHMQGKARILPSSPPGQAFLEFSLPEPEGLSSDAAKPRVLVDLEPMEPLVLGGKYYWVVGGWTIYETRLEAVTAAFRQIAIAIALLGSIVLTVVVGFRVVKH